MIPIRNTFKSVEACLIRARTLNPVEDHENSRHTCFGWFAISIAICIKKDVALEIPCSPHRELPKSQAAL